MRKFILLLIITMTLFSCRKYENIEFIPYEPKIVVEGSIENNRYASVLLTISAPLEGLQDTLLLLENVIRGAKVTVSDGETDEILYLRNNNNRFPPYEYAGRSLKGEQGKHYSLKIEYNGKVLSASTYIPEPVLIEDVEFKKENPSDTTGYPYIRFKNTTDDYYLISTQVSDQNIFVPCLYGAIKNTIAPPDEQVHIQVNKGVTIYPEPDYTTYFNASSSIYVKLSTMPEHGYKFWTSYQNEILNGQNPIFPAHTSLKSNIEGGIGIWCGYGSCVYLLTP